MSAPSVVAVELAGSRVFACRTHACRVRVLDRECSNARPRKCVEWVIAKRRLHGWQAAWMRRIPSCESGWNPYAYFGHPRNRTPNDVVFVYDISAGLFEFKPSTWSGLGLPGRRIWSARWQSIAAERMLEQGRSGEWACH